MMKRAISKGFSLVELMIALGLGSIVTAGVVQLFVANSETHSLLVGQSRMQESARFALDFIGRPTRLAGYQGCYSGSRSTPFTTIEPRGGGRSTLPYEFDLLNPIVGYNATDGSTTWSPALDNVESPLPSTETDLAMNNPGNTVFKTSDGYGAGSGIDVSSIVAGTDVLTIRHISKTEAGVGGYSSGALVFDDSEDTEDDLLIGVPQGWAEFDEDHIVAVHNCDQATFFRVTSANPWGRNADGSPAPAPAPGGGSDNTNLVIGHDIDDLIWPRNQVTFLSELFPFDRTSAISAIESHTFFIAPGAGVNNVGNAPLSLWRKSGLEPPLELVEGVEDLQILYGVDTDNDGTPNRYVAPSPVANQQASLNLVNIVTVRVTVVVNSIDTVGATSQTTHGCDIQDCIAGQTYDGLVRRAFSQTILLRN